MARLPQQDTLLQRFGWIMGFLAGGLLGGFGAPAWEMAGLFVGVIGAVTASLTAWFAKASGKGLIAGIFITILSSAGVAWLSRNNPVAVTVRCVVLIACSGLLGCAIGFAGQLNDRARFCDRS